MDGKTPAYYTDDTYTTVLRNAGSADNLVVKSDANGYRLPTEAQWEYAARGGNPSAGSFAYKWAGTDTEAQVGNYALYNPDDDVRVYSHEVKGKLPNTLGLYDMSGNVFEWCWDRSGSIGTGVVTDPAGPDSGGSRVHRGGSFLQVYSEDVKVNHRFEASPDNASYERGFRVVCMP
jgi:formylglycine-generating enzyme required for sulfatase activity